MDFARPRITAAVLLAFLAAVHANWASGSSWPAKNRKDLAQAVIGSDRLPGPVPCLAVAFLLACASALVAGLPRRRPIVQRGGSGVVAAMLSVRGAIGILGAMPHDRRSPVFARWNRRFYSPLCLVLAGLTACAALASNDEGR